MAAKAIIMEQLKQIIRLKQEGFSISSIARLTGASRPTIIKYLSRINIPIDDSDAAALDDKALSLLLYNNDTTTARGERYTKLCDHFGYAETELSKTGVTRQLLWLEYKQQYADGYNYSQYCYHFGQYLKHKEVVMHLEHKPAETIMIDFAGKKLSYVDTETGEVIGCQVFVAVLPHSGMIFCKAVHVRTLMNL